MAEKSKKKKKKLSKYKYPLLVLLFGIALLMIPIGGGDDSQSEDVRTDESRLEAILQDVSGVGSVKVLLSENGAIVACTGADNAEVRLAVTKAASAFTGFSSDRIQVLKLIRNGE